MLIILIMTSFLLAVPRNKVVVEIGTGTWCPYCPGAAMGADDLVLNGHPVAVIENHNGDAYANVYSNARNSYYGITGYPTAFFDGLNPYVGGSNTASMYNNYLPRVNARLAIPSHFTINAGGGSDGNTVNLTVTIEKTEPDTNTNLRLHCALTESDILQAWQGQTHLEFVNRIMVPDQNGTTIDFTGGDVVTVPLSFTLNPAWVVGNCEIVLFLQNNSTKEILQGTKYTLAELGGASPVPFTNIDFPDMYLTGTATVPMVLSNYWNITATGTITSSNPAFTITPVDRLDFTIPPYQTQTFNVNFVPTAVGDQTGNITIVSNFPDYENIVIPVTGTGFFNTAPAVSDVVWSGYPILTCVLTASYNYTDADSDAEGSSILQWYRITNNVPTPITDANELTYRITQADLGSQIAFKVTPLDVHSMPGTSVMSDPTPLIDVLPTPQNLTAQILNDNIDVELNWEPPIPFNRDFLGYRVFRNGLNINTINNPDITTFTDTWLTEGFSYEYYVTAIYTNPISQSEPSNIVIVNTTSADDQILPAIETVSVYPNPFRSSASVVISGKANAPVQVGIYNIKGQLMQKLESITDADGTANLTLSATETMIPGIYFVRVNSTDRQLTQKVVLLK